MPRDHYLPAAFLGRFSLNSSEPMRDRTIYVCRSRNRKITSAKASKVGYINDYYTLRGLSESRLVDDAWRGYEDNLIASLDDLIDPTVASISAEQWVRTLVPFVAGVLVRTPDFVRRFERGVTISQLSDDPTWMSDNTNIARMMAMQRSFAPIMAAQWIVMHTSNGKPLITNDVGYVNQYSLHDQREFGLTIPLGGSCALQLLRCPDGQQRRIAFYAPGESQWRALIEHRWIEALNEQGLNASVSRHAHEFIVGPTAEVLDPYAAMLGSEIGIDEDQANPLTWTSHRMQIVHELDWYRLTSALGLHYKDSHLPEFEIDWDAVTRGWHPPMPFLSTNLPEFAGGLSIRGRVISLGMTEVPGFTDYAPGPFPWDTDESSDLEAEADG